MGDNHKITKADIEPDPEKQKKLDAFRERAKRMRSDEEVQRVYETFENLEEFASRVAIAMGNLPGCLEKSAVLARPPVDSGPRQTIGNIPISVPRHFLGRDDDLAEIDKALKKGDGRAAITALHGLRGVGKTVLAAAYAEQHRDDYRATWWIRAETQPTMRADLVGLGIQLGWVAAESPEEPAMEAVLQQLRVDGDGVLLIYDNATTPNELNKFLPHGAGPRIIITSNAPNWRGVAAPLEIEVWPNDTGADFLIVRTGRQSERKAAIALSEALGGLPLAHEQAAAYCERTGVTLAEYIKRFEKTPAVLLDGQHDASREYHDGLTVAKTFALAIVEAAKRHQAAEPLIVYAALLAPEPIPLYLFSEARDEFGESFASSIKGNGLDEAVAALRAFALIDRESIPDERDAGITTDCIRLHRLVRQISIARRSLDERTSARKDLIKAMAIAYPADVHRNPAAWLRARRLDPAAMALVADSDSLPEGSELAAANLLGKLDGYRDGALAAYAEARKLSEKALAIQQKVLGPDHPVIANSLNNLGYLLQEQGNLAEARSYYERALAIREKSPSSNDVDLARSLSNLGSLLQLQGDLAKARPYHERSLRIREEVLGPSHPETASSLNNLGSLLEAQGNPAGARPYHERALAIREQALGPNHPDVATSLNNLGYLLQAQGNIAEAGLYHERALAIREQALGANHPQTATSLNNLGSVLRSQGNVGGALALYERALAIREKSLGPHHPKTATSLSNLASVLQENGDFAGAGIRLERALAIREKSLGLEHPDTASSLNSLGYLLRAQGDLAGARAHYQRSLTIRENALGLDHPDTANSLSNLGYVLHAQGDYVGARNCTERSLRIREQMLGFNHPLTAMNLCNLGAISRKQGDLSAERAYYERALDIYEKTFGLTDPNTRAVAVNVAAVLKKLGLREQAKALRLRFGL